VPDEDADKPEVHPAKLNFASALGEAGHEVADLGLENVPDSGSLLHDAGAADLAEERVPDALGAWTQGGVGPEIAERDRENAAGPGDDPHREAGSNH
jgi:hypothetical protein